MRTHSRVHVGRLTTLAEGPDGLRFALDDGSVLTAEGVAPAFAFWSRLLTVSRSYGWPLYARCDPVSGAVRVLLPANAYTVADVRPDPEGDGRRVAFVESHALHRLRGTRPDHEGMARRLEEAQRTGSRVLVTESPRDPEILDVRFDARAAAPTA